MLVYLNLNGRIKTTKGRGVLSSLRNPFGIRLAQINDTKTLLEIRKEAILALTEIVTDVSKVEQWTNSAGPDRTKTAIAKHIVWVAEYQSNLVGWVEVNAETTSITSRGMDLSPWISFCAPKCQPHC